MATAKAQETPKRIGRYRVIAPLGKGGMANVYLAKSEGPAGFSKSVAIKVLHANLAADDDLVAQFITEAKIAAEIRHPNVVSVHAVEEDDNGVYLVMDYADGASLAWLHRAAQAAGGGLPLAVTLRILCDALSGLHAAHELRGEDGRRLGIVHRDFTPQNILVGMSGVAQLTDFGVAKVLSAEGQTRTGVIKGKVRYMAPEQTRGQELDRRCDVWAAGVMAWEMLAGQRLYPGKDDVAMLVAIATSAPPKLREANPQLDPQLEQVVAWALERDLSKRCPDAETLRAALFDAAQASVGVADSGAVAAVVHGLARDRHLTHQEAAQIIGAASEPTYDPGPGNLGTQLSDGQTQSVTIEPATTGKVRSSKRRWPAALGFGLGGAVVTAGVMTLLSSKPAERAPAVQPAPATAQAADEPEAEVAVTVVHGSAYPRASAEPPASGRAAEPAPSASTAPKPATAARPPRAIRPVVRGKPKPKPKPKGPDTLPPSPYEKQR